MGSVKQETAGDIAAKFMRAGGKRLETAEFLLAHGYHLDSMYLAGYCVECSIKAMILRRCSPAKRQRMLQDEFRGKRGHNFQHLVGLLNMVRCSLPAAESRDLRAVATWSPEFRYEDGRRNRQEAERFVAASRSIRAWAISRW